MLIGLASRTAISKPVRYNSRMVRSSTTELLAWRRSSWLLTAKCFGHADAVALDAANEAGGHTAGDDRIFRIVLEVASAQRVAFDVHARSKQHVHVEIVRFLAQRLAHFSASAGSQVLATVQAVGKQVAGLMRRCRGGRLRQAACARRVGRRS